jgi:hypothetical protein
MLSEITLHFTASSHAVSGKGAEYVFLTLGWGIVIIK